MVYDNYSFDNHILGNSKTDKQYIKGIKNLYNSYTNRKKKKNFSKEMTRIYP